MITKNVKLYLGDEFPVRIPVSQYDTMWQFVFTIIHNSQPWQIPTGATAVLNGKKPDGNVFAFSGTIADNKVTVDCDVQMTAVAGQTVCELSILADGKTVGTANFTLAVESAPNSTGATPSASDVDAYGTIISGELDTYFEQHPEMIEGKGLSEPIRLAILNCFRHVAWVDEHGSGYYNALYDLLINKEVLSITAVFEQGSAVIYDTDTLDTLKQYLTVTASYDDGTNSVVTTYELSGTLSAGTSTITVGYGGKTTTFNVTVTENVLYSLQNHTFANANPIATGLKLLENDRDITFAFDVDFAGQQRGTIWKLFACINGSGAYEGLAVQGSSASAPYPNGMQIQNMTDRYVYQSSDVRNYVGNVKYVVTHSVGSGKWHYYYKIGSASVVDAVATSAFVSITGQLTIGGTASGSQVFNGTVNVAKVYPRVLTSEEIAAFMG